MKQIRRKRVSIPAVRKRIPEPKNTENLLNQGDNFVNLIAEIVFENLLNKHKK
jgi:hypothetical protein